jgi:uncharacterized membrane protein YbhN (UPF0104 family)
MEAGSNGRGSRTRATLWLLARCLVTGGLVAWVAARADWRQLLAGLTTARPSWLVVAFWLSAANICVGAARWRLVLRSLGVRISWSNAFRLCWSGQFFNTFVPSGVAGDALRSAWAGEGHAVRSAVSVVLDRAAAVVALAFAVSIGLALPVAETLPARPVMAAGAAVVGLFGALLLAFPKFATSQLARFSRTWRRKLASKPLTAAIPRAPRLAAVGLALVTQALIVATGVALARGAGVPLSWAAALATLPAAMVTAYVPFAISGMGVRDAALVVLLGRVGVSASGAWALSLLFLLMAWAVALVGGAVYLLATPAKRPRPLRTLTPAPASASVRRTPARSSQR